MKIGLIEITQITLILLKVFGVVAWSWWLVFAPLLLTLATVVALFALVVIAVFTFPEEATKWQNSVKRFR